MAFYLHDIPSVLALNPNLPNVLGPLDLNRSIQAGDPILRDDLIHARSVASVLKAIHEDGNAPEVTEHAAVSAQLRATAVQNAHSTASYAPADLIHEIRDITAQLHGINRHLDEVVTAELRGINRHLDEVVTAELRGINTRLDEVVAAELGINRRLDEVVAATQNNRILARNARAQGFNALSPLHKTVPGHGLAQAQALLGRQPDQLIVPNPEPAVGALPPNFSPNLPAYRHIDIFNLIIFYNDNFGIVVGDTLPIRIEKFRMFLKEF